MSLARMLIVRSIVVNGGALLLGTYLWRHGVHPALAVFAAIAVEPALQALLITPQFITGAFKDKRPGARLGLWAALRLWIREVWLCWRMFGWQMPYRSRFAEPRITHNPVTPAVLLIHGYLCNRAVWKPLLDSKALSHCNVATLNLEPVFAPLDNYAASIHRAIEDLRQRSGATQVTLICHSMGGLAARTYLRQYGVRLVRRVITLSTPHQGTWFARCGFGFNAQQMRSGSPYLAQLARDSARHAELFTCVGSCDDNLIIPRTSLWMKGKGMEGAENIVVEEIGHLSLIASPATYALLAARMNANAQPHSI